MINIEELKQKQAHDLANAIRANFLEEKLGNDELNVSILDNFKSSFHTQRLRITRNPNFKPVTAEQAGEILTKFPIEHPFKVFTGQKNSELELPCKLEVRKNTIDNYDKVSIAYNSDDIEIGFDMEIDTNDDEVMQFFARSTRKLERSEYPSPRTRWTADRFDNYPILSWNCGKITNFQGGYRLQYAEGIIGSFIEMLKYKYQFAQL